MANGKKEEIYKTAERETVERPWASNDKLTYDNTMTHCKNLMNYSEISISNALEFQQKMNNEYLKREQQAAENNRYTLNYLYGIYPEEAPGIAVVMEELKKYISEEIAKSQ